MSITLTALMKQRYDTAANWTAQNPTLLAGEFGIESDTKRWKVGTGATAWTSLLYSNGGTYPLVNADIAAGAEIAVSKLADGSARQLLQTDAAGTGVEWTSDVSIPGALSVTGNVNIDGGTLYVDAVNNRVGVNTITPLYPMHVVATTDGPQILLLLQNTSVGGTNETATLAFVIAGTAGSSACKIIAGKESDHSSPANIDSFLQFTTTENDAEAVRMHITAAGKVGFGTVAPAATLHSRADNAGSGSIALLMQNRSVAANTAVGISFAPNVSDSGDRSAIIYGVNTSGGSGNATDLTFHTNANGGAATEKARIDSSGRLLVGTSTRLLSDARNRLNVDSGSGTFVTASFKNDAGSAAQVSELWNASTSGDAKFISFLTEAAGTERGLIDYNRAAGLVRYNVTSDRRLKSAIQPATSAVDVLSSIQVRSYIWTETGYTVNYGFVAQELNQVLPDAVKAGDDGEEVQDTWAVDNSKLVPLLTKALQEAIAKIETMEARLSALEGA